MTLFQVLSLINHASPAPIATANLVVTHVRAELHKMGLDVVSVNQPPPNACLLLPPSVLPGAQAIFNPRTEHFTPRDEVRTVKWETILF